MLKRIVLLTATLVVLLFSAATIALRQPVFARSRYVAHGRADANRLRRDVAALAAHRDPDFIARELRKTGAVVTEQPFRARGAMYRNVIASFGPATPEVLVVGAHYDAFNDLPGADDNASGTAGLLELARLLGKETLTSSVVLVAYANEEPPFFGSEQMGSAVHAASIEQRRVTAMICLEMIGYFQGRQRWDSWVLGLMYPDRADFIGVAGGWADRRLARRVKRAMTAARGVDVLSFSGPRELLDASDHRNYWSRGWSAVLITDTGYLRNPNYHTRRDTAETLDYAKMGRVVDGVLNAVVSLPAHDANAGESPEAGVVERDQDQVVDLRDRCDLAVDERRSLAPSSKTCSFAGVPFRGRAVIVEDRDRRQDDFVQIAFDGCAPTRSRKPLRSEPQLVPHDRRDGDFILVPPQPSKNRRRRFRPERLGDDVRIEQVLQGHRRVFRPGDLSRTSANTLSGSILNSARSTSRV